MIEWTNDKTSSNIDRFFGRVNNIMFFEIYKFKNDHYVMTVKIPGTKTRIKTNEDINILKEEALIEYTSFLKGLMSNEAVDELAEHWRQGRGDFETFSYWLEPIVQLEIE